MSRHAGIALLSLLSAAAVAQEEAPSPSRLREGEGEGEESAPAPAPWAVHPWPAPISPFIAVGMELNAIAPPCGDFKEGALELVPEVRGGFSLLREPHTDYFNQTFPDLR